MALILDNYQLSQVDLLTRNGNYSKAIEICQDMLALSPPRYLVGTYGQLMATAYSFVNDFDAAVMHTKQAIAMFEALDADDLCTVAVIQLANYLGSYRQDERWKEAEQLLKDWIPKTEQSGGLDDVLLMQSTLFQNFFNRYYYSPTEQGQPGMLASAEQVLQDYEAILPRLTNERERNKKFGSYCQLRGMLAQARDDSDGVEQAWEEALAAHESSGLAMEAANCRYILGSLNLNQANAHVDWIPFFSKAETNFQASLHYYQQATMRSQAGDTCFMLARLYTNAARRITLDVQTKLLDAALDYLAEGVANFDAMRREFTTGSLVQAQAAKQSITGKSWRLYELALEVTVGDRPNVSRAWAWAQHAKARSLGDLMGVATAPLARIIEDIRQHPDAYELVLQEQDLARRLNTVDPENCLDLKQDLAEVQQRMLENPRLAEYLELRMGIAVTQEDIEALQATESKPFVCVDWVAIGKTLWLLIKRPGQSPTMHRLSLNIDDVSQFLERYFTPTSNLRDSLRELPECLEHLNPLVEPLATHTHADELLILSPTRLLHAIPLHALSVNHQVLIERNPVVYCPSLGILRYAIARRPLEPKFPSAAFFGDPSGDRTESGELLQDLAQLYQTTPYLTGTVTRERFTTMMSNCTLVHFQGHARHVANDPLGSHLVLSDGQLTARGIFGLPAIAAEHVILAACESAVNVLKTGDDPLGLIPAFLVAGTRSVLATLWRVNQSSTIYFMRAYHDYLLRPSTHQAPFHKAQALRQAVLSLRQHPDYSAPYHWAPFVLYGDWQ